MKLQKFKVTEYQIVTIKKVYWVEAEDEDVALDEVMSVNAGEAVTEKVINREIDGPAYEVKKVRRF